MQQVGLIFLLLMVSSLYSQNLEWGFAFNVNSSIEAISINHITKGTKDEIILTGEFKDSLGTYPVIAIDSTGMVIWKGQDVSTNSWYGNKTIQKGQNFYTLLSDQNSTNTDGDIALVKFNANGNKIWLNEIYDPYSSTGFAIHYSKNEESIFLFGHFGFSMPSGGGYFNGGEIKLFNLSDSDGKVIEDVALFKWSPLGTGTLTNKLNLSEFTDSTVTISGGGNPNFKIFNELISHDNNPFFVSIDFKNERVIKKQVLKAPNGIINGLVHRGNQYAASGYFNLWNGDTNTLEVGDTTIYSQINSTHFVSVFDESFGHSWSAIQRFDDFSITRTIDFGPNETIGTGFTSHFYDSTISNSKYANVAVFWQRFKPIYDVQYIEAGTNRNDKIIGTCRWGKNSRLALIKARWSSSPPASDSFKVGSQTIPIIGGDYIIAQFRYEIEEFLDQRIIESNNSDVKFYPNPSTAEFKLKLPSDIDAQKIEVFSMHGDLILAKKITNHNFSLDLSRYSSGVYVVSIETDQGITTKKLIKN